MNTELTRWKAILPSNSHIVKKHIEKYELLLINVKQFKESNDDAIKSRTLNQIQDMASKGIESSYGPGWLLSTSKGGTAIIAHLTGKDEYSRSVDVYFGYRKNEAALMATNPEQLKAFFSVHYEVLSHDPRRENLDDRVKASIGNLLEKAEHDIEEAHIFANKKKSEVDTLLKSIQDDSDLRSTERATTWSEFMTSVRTDVASQIDSMENLKRVYHDEIALLAPSTHWKDAAEEYRKQGTLWTSILFAVSILSIIPILILLLSDASVLNRTIQDATNGVVNLNSVKAFLLIATLLSIIAFAIRTTAKLALSAFHLKRDAEERFRLTQYYLSLAQYDPGALLQQRPIILQSLFSRADTGLLSKGDHGVTMPFSADFLKNVTAK
ncbi:MAG TPA: DUF6161 domain-containing protein [Bacteroidota bacterium]|nr:DUF6161 domain-containing protein [Bacteroidota bacterium]